MKLQPSVPVSRLSVNSRRTVKFPGTARETGAEGAPRRTLQHFPVYQAPKRQSAAVRMKSIQNGAFIRNAPSIGPSAQPMFVPIRMRLKMRGRSAGVEISLRNASDPIWKKVPIPALTVSAAAKSHFGTQPFVIYSWFAALGEMTAHHDDDGIAVRFLFGLSKLVGVAIMKRIVFSDQA